MNVMFWCSDILMVGNHFGNLIWKWDSILISIVQDFSIVKKKLNFDKVWFLKTCSKVLEHLEVLNFQSGNSFGNVGFQFVKLSHTCESVFEFWNILSTWFLSHALALDVSPKIKVTTIIKTCLGLGWMTVMRF